MPTTSVPATSSIFFQELSANLSAIFPETLPEMSTLSAKLAILVTPLAPILARAFITSPKTSAILASFGATLLIVLISLVMTSLILPTVLEMNPTACGTTHAKETTGGARASSA
ncbi:hypothetical protein OU415_06090 [Saccharopolyspora sp. WRP15-2]|uniref:Uncharacterized protein n=1 Tax=Saccharopolyspora oryzae TaxID=2997343 RepID=A0ABT4UTG3_9PSEU|nr:hypothetical protein [Saccharopolyspora oryzae]MDA3624995.1 hypothetical protein [Saccharopolyspora oryzae]